MSEAPSETIGANELRDQNVVAAVSSNPFVLPDHGEESHPPTFDDVIKSSPRAGALTLLLDKGEGGDDPVRHLIGTALPWDGLSEDQPYYLNVDLSLPVGKYELTITDVPADASWSITAYTKNGFPGSDDLNMYNVNSVTAIPNGDGSVTVHFGACGDDCLNCLPITEGWSYIVRLYRAHRKSSTEGESSPSKP